MRVLAVSKMFPRSDKPLSGVFVLGQAKNLAGLGVKIGVVCPTPHRPFHGSTSATGQAVSKSRLEGVPVTYVPYPHVPLRVSTRLEVHTLVKRILPVVRSEHAQSPISVLHAHQLYPVGAAVVVIGKRLRIPVVCTAHGSDVHTNPGKNRGIARYTRAVLRLTDRTVAVSQDLATRIARMEPRAAPVEVIYNGIDPLRFSVSPDKTLLRRRLKLPESGVGVCFVGRLTAAKGVFELASAFQSVQRSDSTAWMVVVGDGAQYNKLATLVSSQRVVLTGSVPHERVSDYLNASDIFVLPSHGEGVPVAMLEAMACGLPVVATNVGGIPEAVTDQVAGFLVAPGDSNSLADRIEDLVSDVGLRRKFGQAGRKKIDEAFHWSHGSTRLIDLYHRLGSER